MKDCSICVKHSNRKMRIIFENENWILSYGPINSQIAGYLYLEPKRHVEYWTELNDVELTAMGPIIKQVEAMLKDRLNIDRLYVVTISEAVRHLHLHIIPREEGGNVKGLPLIERALNPQERTTDSNTEAVNQLIQQLTLYMTKA